MSNDIEHINIEFHNRAKGIYFSLYHAFQTAAAAVNRKQNEYHFQELKEQYVKTLKQQLEMVAEEMIAGHQHHRQIQEIDQGLNTLIKEYLHLFLQKIRKT